jgi:hypothetical protein
MEGTLRDGLAELLSKGGGEPLGDGRFLPLVTLDSGARCGLDAALRWVFVPEGRPAVVVSPETAMELHEVVEWPRGRFDTALEEGARATGLPAEEVVAAFPAIDVVRAVLAKSWPYTTRLALLWILPSELRELREEVLEASSSPAMPGPIKDLARRLVVPA